MYIIIGAGKGLGKKIAIHYSNLIKGLIISGRSKENLQETKRQINDLNPNCKVFIELLDFNDIETIDKFINNLKKYNKVRALINTAASFYKGSFKDQSMNSIEELLNTNFKGVVYLISNFVKEVQYTVPIDIVNITSISSATNLDTSRSSSTHIGTKASLHLFSKILGRELSQEGIRITSVAPGTFARKGRIGIREEVIIDTIDYIINLPSEAWIESIDIRPTQK